MINMLKSFETTNPITGEITKSLRRYPRVFADIDLDPGPNPVQQQYKDECDVNFIVKNYQIPPFNPNPEEFGDFSDPLTFQESFNVVINAQNQFLKLPAKTRAYFENDPQQFLAFVADSSNGDELVRLGLASLVKPTPEAPPQKVILVNPDASNDDSTSSPSPKSKPTK